MQEVVLRSGPGRSEQRLATYAVSYCNGSFVAIASACSRSEVGPS